VPEFSLSADHKYIKIKPEKFEEMDDDEKYEYVVKMVTKIHERRHFHDWISTPYGMQMFYGHQKLLNEFLVTLLPVMNTLKEICLPLIKWALKAECPREIKEFVKACEEQIRTLDWYSGCVPLPEKYSTNQLLSEYQSGRNQSIPVLNLLGTDEGLSVIGGTMILENIAFVMEADFIRQNYGRIFENRRNEDVVRQKKGGTYLGCWALFNRVVKGRKYFDPFQKLCEYALNISPGRKDEKEGHPGWRFIVMLEYLARIDTPSVTDFAAAEKEIEREKGWNHSRDIYAGCIEYANAQIEHNKKRLESLPSHASGIVNRINLQYYTWAHKMLKLKLGRVVDFWASESYLDKIEILPCTPVIFRRKNDDVYIQVNAGSIDDKNALMDWYYLWWIFRGVMYESKITCPIKYSPEMKGGTCPARNKDCGINLTFGEKVSPGCVYCATMQKLGMIRTTRLKISGVE
jgi:hypothetical protein